MALMGWKVVSLHSWQKRANPSIYDPPLPPPLLYCLHPFFKFCPPHKFCPQTHFPVISNPHPHGSFCCSVFLAEWVIMPHVMCYFTNDNMDRHMSGLGTRRTLICVLCNKASSLLWSDT